MRKLIGKVLTRRDTSANWTKNNPILGKGECGYATDLRRTKHGDGTTRWNSLPWDDAATTNGHTVNSDVPAGAKFTDTTYTLATTSANGLMSAADKTKLDGIGAGSNVKSVNGKTGAVVLDADDVGALPDTTVIPTKTSDLTNDSDFMSGMTILAYGKSTWADFIAAYTARHVVYCRASTNSDPASGSQTRMAFMGYVDNETNPTNVEFQYYRSVKSHNATQQGDQVYVYKLDKTAGWTVTVRECYTRIVAGTGITATYSNGVLTIADAVTIKTVKVNGTALTPDSDKAVNVTVPTLANNATTTTSGMALDARMGKALADQVDALAKKNNGLYFDTNSDGKWGYKTSSTGTLIPFRNPTGNAAAADVLSGKTFSSASQENEAGTMPYRGQYQYTKTMRVGNGYYALNRIPEGCYRAEGQSWAPEIRIAIDDAKKSQMWIDAYTNGYEAGYDEGYETGYKAGEATAGGHDDFD